jgi:uncharacterized protein YqjF (DUF2071 family)
MERPAMKQTWSKLLFLHWPMAADDLRRFLPPVLEVDTFEGQAWVGLVPFTISGVRVRFLPPLPFFSGFHEVNVRTYVRHQGREPGVWFFSLDAASRLAVMGARRLYKLPYHHARIEMAVAANGVSFASGRVPGTPDVDVRYSPAGAPLPAEPGTLVHFLAERYLLYSTSGSRLHRARVHHVPYPLQPAEVHHLRETRIGSHGLARPDAAPLAHYASRVDVDVGPLEDVVPAAPTAS